MHLLPSLKVLYGREKQLSRVHQQLVSISAANKIALDDAKVGLPVLRLRSVVFTYTFDVVLTHLKGQETVC